MPPSGFHFLPHVPCIPSISNVFFFDASSSSQQGLVDLLQHRRLSVNDLLVSFVVPHLKSQPDWLLDPLLKFIFDKLPLAPDIIRKLSDIPFVSVCAMDGSLSANRLRPHEVIDRNSVLQTLYFNDEPVFGNGLYSADREYRSHLNTLGVNCYFNTYVADERLRNYYNRAEDTDGIFDKYKALLKNLNSNPGLVGFKPEWLHFMRLPAIADNECILHPSRCRSESFRPLIEGVLGIVPMHVSETLQTAFGWDEMLSPSIICSRIEFITSSSSPSVEQSLRPVLEYLNQIVSKGERHEIDGYISEVKGKLASRAWLPGTSDGLWPPDRVFFAAARDFEPYMTEAPLDYRHNLAGILSLFGVSEKPSSSQLVKFIAALGSPEPLSERDLGAAIKAIEQLELCSPDLFFKDLMIPDIRGILFTVDQFVARSGEDESGIKYAHSRVPTSLVYKYNVRRLDDNGVILNHLAGPDVFEDYFQEESIVTRISKFLKRIFVVVSVQ